MTTKDQVIRQVKHDAAKLLDSPAFLHDLDGASCDVMAIIEEIVGRHGAHVGALKSDDEMGDVVAVMLGWILGFSIRRDDVRAEPPTRLTRRCMMLHTAAGFSSGNAEEVRRGLVS